MELISHWSAVFTAVGGRVSLKSADTTRSWARCVNQCAVAVLAFGGAFAYATDRVSLRPIPLAQLMQRAPLIGPLDDAITCLRLARGCAMRKEWRI
ncbi:hypothetical protein TcWFU_007822 [Taenia crassiceps]|uniref:DUF1232 domain-containing protein n=1 Tax=Taenia crassiceps TaxID=6207 RepID=A0ABR4Q331_9CEST